MSATELEESRQQVIARLQERASEAAAKSTDRYWANGPHNVQRWVERGYLTAIAIVQGTPPTANESPAAYFARLREEVRAVRDDGPDDDDEGWFSGAIDEATRQIG